MRIASALMLSATLSFSALGVVPPAAGARPPIQDVLPRHFGFGISAFSGGGTWPEDVAASHGIQWDYLYAYFVVGWTDSFLRERVLARAGALGAIPVVTHYQLLERGQAAGHSGADSWDVVVKAVGDSSLMRAYFDDIERAMKGLASSVNPVIFQTEPDSTAWLMLFHTGETFDATRATAAVASSGHPDLVGLPDTIAGLHQAVVRLRDLYAPDTVYLGLCAFDFRGGWNPEHTVTYVNSLNRGGWDILFEKEAVKYSTKGDGWWNSFDPMAQARYLEWLRTVSSGTGLRFLNWQLVIGAADYGMLEDYPAKERVSDLIAAGSVGSLFDLQTLEGPPHSTPGHGFTTSPPPEHPAYNSLERLAARLRGYYQQPLLWNLQAANLDSDGDGLTDEDELNIHHTSPQRVDTDGDGWSDSTEIRAGTDPNDPAETPAAPLPPPLVRGGCQAKPGPVGIFLPLLLLLPLWLVGRRSGPRFRDASARAQLPNDGSK